MNTHFDTYKSIFFSFIERDEDFPAIKKIKGFKLRGFLSVVYYTILEELSDLLKSNPSKINGKIWLFVESTNQLHALSFLKKMKNTEIVTVSKQLAITFKKQQISTVFLTSKFKHRLKRVFYLGNYRKLFKKNRVSHLNTIFKYDGIYESLNDLLIKTKPRAIVLANDHNVMSRTIMLAAKKQNIKTIYLQHAAVTEKFPPLEFDLSLLDGKDSLVKYSSSKIPKGKIALIGMPKFDKHFNSINKNNKIQTIGIALNNYSDFEKYDELSKLIMSNFNALKFIYRFHPSVNLLNHKLPKSIKLSKAKEESSFDFLKKIDLLFSENSSIHLEATLLNVLSVCIKFDLEPITDYYGFIKNNMIDALPKDTVLGFLENCIDNKPNVRDRAKYYIESIDTSWDGKSSEKAIEIINKLLL